MGLDFTVGTAAAAFKQPFDSEVERAVESEFGITLPRDEQEYEAYYSEEVGWSWWGMLQERAASVLGEERVTHLLAVEAWQGVFLPARISPTRIQPRGFSAPVQCASLPELARELEAFAEALTLPTDEGGLRALVQKYNDDDELVDSDGDIQTYVQLMLAAKDAVLRNLPLWVVK
jgi:hypothetical protein